MTVENLVPGSILCQRYRFEKRLGPEGSALLCRDLRKAESWVVLRPLAYEKEGERPALLLRQYFSNLGRLHHPDLARALDVGVLDTVGACYWVEEHVVGTDLFLASEGWGLEKILRTLSAICRVLQFLHVRGIVHGSLRPSHVLVLDREAQADGIKLVGLRMPQALTNATRASASGMIAYTAPEILLGAAPAPRSDFYSLGILAYQLLTRRLPFEQGHQGYLLQKHLQGRADMRPIERLECGPGLAQALSTLLEKDPEKRPSSAEDLAQLLNVASGRDLSAGIRETPESCFSAGPFVSREREMQFLRDRAGRVRETGRGWTVFVSGESGTGKSRCMEEFRLWAQLKGWRVVEGSCRPHEGRPYEPFREILETGEGNPAFDSTQDTEIFRFSEKHGEASPDSLELSTESAAAQFRDLLTRELVRRLRGGPTILLLHDLHWADQAITTVLDYLTSDVLAHPILLCVSLRPGEAGESPVRGLMEKALRQERAEMISLESLPEEAVADLIAGMTGDQQFGAGMGPILHRATGGNPFFVEEMLKHLVERGVLRRDLGRWCLEQDGFTNLEVPGSIALVLRHRLDTMSRPARTLAGWLALFSRPVSRDLLVAAVPGASPTLEESLTELLSRQVLRCTRAEGKEFFDFRHILISEVIRADLSKAERRKMHRCIGEALERLESAQPNLQELATHFTEGSCGGKAVEYALKAATASRAEFAHESALRFYEYVLTHGDSFSQEQLCQVGIEAAEVCCAIGQAKRAVKILEERLRRGRALPPRFRAQITAYLAISQQHLGNFERVSKLARAGLRLLSASSSVGDGVTKAILLKQLSFCELIKSHPKRGLALLQDALAAIRANPYGVLAGHIYTTIAAMHWVACNFPKALEASKTAVKILEDQRALHLLPLAHSHLGACYSVLARFGLASREHERAVEISKRSRDIVLRAQALGNQAETLCRSGQLREARRVAEMAINFIKDSGNSTMRHGLLATLAEIGITEGDYILTSRTLEQLKEYENSNPALYSRGHVHYLAACFALEIGNHTDCMRHLECLRRIQSGEAPIYQAELADALRARISAERGSMSHARNTLEKLSGITADKRWPYQMCLVRLSLANLLINVNDLKAARRPARDALRLARSMPSLHLLANSLLLSARMRRLEAKHLAGDILENSVSPIYGNHGAEKSRSELLEGLRHAERSASREHLWRIHAELANLEEANANPSGAARHAERAIECMNELETLVPAANLDSYRNVPERKHARSDCERLLAKARSARLRESTFPDMEEEHLRILFRFSGAIASIRELEPLLDAITAELAHSVGVERVLIFLPEGSEGRLRLAKGRGRDGGPAEETDSVNRGILEEVYHSCAPFVSANVLTDARLNGGSTPSNAMPGTVFCGPLASGGKSLGVLYADHSKPSALPGESTINFLAAFCNLAASAIDNSLVHGRLVQENIELERHLRRARGGFAEIVGESAVMMRLRDRIAMVARSPLDALIVGESGSGKELVARALHRTGKRASGNFIGVDCGSLADTLAESEFFGYRKGAFTGAVENRAGLLEAANGGVIFFDEISNLTLRLQGKLLRVLQEREVRRIGETIPRKIDVQVFAATNKDLKLEVEKGRFREDLYYRLNAMQIRVPPLRERMEDVPILIAGFLENASQTEGGRPKNFSREAMDFLLRYSYPGNVRELKNVVLSSYYSCPGSTIQIEHMPPEVREGSGVTAIGEDERAARPLYDRLRKGKGNFNELVKKPFQERRIAQGTVRQLLHMALAETGGRYRDAFRLLRIPSKDYSTIMVFLKRHGCYLDFRPYRRRSGSERPPQT